MYMDFGRWLCFKKKNICQHFKTLTPKPVTISQHYFMNNNDKLAHELGYKISPLVLTKHCSLPQQCPSSRSECLNIFKNSTLI